MEKSGIELLLVFAPANINYLIGTPSKGYQEFQVLFFLEPPPFFPVYLNTYVDIHYWHIYHSRVVK